MIILLGMPGAGKTTQTQMLAESLNCPWFSMGELIREKATGKDRAEMLAGKIIGDKVTLEILETAINAEHIDMAKDEFIVEGNPRTIPQADWWLAKVAKGQVKITAIIELVVTIQQAEDRLNKRGRVDDASLKVVHKRFEEYQRAVTPTLDYLMSKGLTVRKVDASGSIPGVAKQIKASVGLDLR